MSQHFTAAEFAALQSKATSSFSTLVSSLKVISEACSKMGSIVESGDSGLASRWNSISESISKVKESANGTYNVIDGMMSDYAANTIANEENSEVDMTAIDEELGSLDEKISNLLDIEIGHTGGPGAGTGSGTGSSNPVDPGTLPPVSEPKVDSNPDYSKMYNGM